MVNGNKIRESLPGNKTLSPSTPPAGAFLGMLDGTLYPQMHVWEDGGELSKQMFSYMKIIFAK